jgi:cellulose synthase operon protein C
MPVANSPGPSSAPTPESSDTSQLGPSRSVATERRLPLCLSANKGRLGLELREPVEIGPLVVENLVLAFENLRFPLDLSGGVPVFRHRRGQLQRILFSLDLSRLRQWLEPRIRNVIGALDRPLDLWFTGTGIGFGWVQDSSAVAGELHWVPCDADARFVIDGVRGVDAHQVVLAKVIHTLDAALSDTFSRDGRIWTHHKVGRTISRSLLPAAGARAPAADDVRFGLLSSNVDGVRIELDTHISENPLAPSTLRALELAELAASADDALAGGQVESARAAYVRALEQAPRQRELVLTVAEIDILAGGREHAALALVNETMPAIAAGNVGAELLNLLGDRNGAVEALDTAIRSERYAPLRALLQLRKAEFEIDAAGRVRAVDEAVAAAPTLSSVRWVRFETRAKRGDVDGAMADAQFLETSATAIRSKFDVCMRCGAAMADAGLSQQAARFFERALRYRPDDSRAAVGLARAFVAVGQPLRAITLLERALANTQATGQPDASAQLLMACLIAKETGDLSQAVARTRQISSGSAVAVQARMWEGRWRTNLGDLIGASVAWARMRELVELGQQPIGAADWLAEAAEHERDMRHDLLACERHLAVALRVSPNDERIQTLYRRAAADLAAVSAKTPPRD